LRRVPAWLPNGVQAHLAHGQHRAAYYLTLNNVMGAATGVLFWLLLARAAGLGAALIGVGYTVVALGTLVGVVAKGGLDTALLLKVPGQSGRGGRALLSFGATISASVAVALTALLAWAALRLGFLPGLDALGWGLVGFIAVLMVVTWLQDAYFLAVGQARMTFERNLVLTAGRLVLPLPVILLAFAHPVPLTWGLALAASAVVGAVRVRAIPDRPARDAAPALAPRRDFMRSAARNVSGSAAEFLPGLLLAPLVLALQGPEAAAYFGMAWTAASLIFQISGAIGRSALAQMVQAGPTGTALAIRKGVAEHAWVVAPLAVVVGLLSFPLLSVFGHAYATQGAEALAILCASIVVVAPVSLYLAVLRSRDRSWLLVAFPIAMILALAVLAPALGARYGLVGIAFAWLAANAPFGLYAAWRLRREVLEVMPHAGPYAEPVPGRADLE
jgi:O-antigen/teichoic acid export membrane protein